MLPQGFPFPTCSEVKMIQHLFVNLQHNFDHLFNVNCSVGKFLTILDSKYRKVNTMIIYLKYKYWSLCSAHSCLLFKLTVPSPRHSLRDLIYLPINLVLRQNLSSFLFGNLEENKPKCILYLKENRV